MLVRIILAEREKAQVQVRYVSYAIIPEHSLAPNHCNSLSVIMIWMPLSSYFIWRPPL